ncbi:MAG: beta-ketoacyl-ACP synthase III [Candidatus Omnitrophota bacterium]
MGIKIVSTGSYLPKKVLTNQDLEKMVDTSDEWIRTRTGISERRIAAPEEAVSDLGFHASLRALKKAGVSSESVEVIIVATITGDHPFPSTACLIQKKLGAKNAFAFDIAAACSGFLYGLAIARGLIVSGHYRNVLLVAADTMSRVADYTDRSTCVLLGDGAGAAFLSFSKKDSILGSCLFSDGNLAEILLVPAGGSRRPASKETVEQRMHFMKMDGQALFKVAVQAMSGAARQALEKAGVAPDQISLVIPHQANLRIIQAVVKNLNLPLEKVFLNIHRYGNISAASVVVCLDEAISTGLVKEGDLVLFCSFGAGLTWAATVVRL